MESCEFCAIASGKSKAERVFGDDFTVAFVPLRPANPGHVLVVPREHFRDLWALGKEAAHHLTDTVLLLAHALRRSLRPDGMNVINSAGSAASQSVFHVHVHLVPRWENDGFGDIWPRSKRCDDEETARATERLRADLERTIS